MPLLLADMAGEEEKDAASELFIRACIPPLPQRVRKAQMTAPPGLTHRILELSLLDRTRTT